MPFGKKAVACRWQVPLFRALRDGHVDVVDQLISENPTTLHKQFTKDMEEWELQLESKNWMELVDATPLYLAATYAQYDVVQWLIDRGADPTQTGFRGMKPVEMCGEYIPPAFEKKDKQAIKKCQELLKGPKRVPIAPNTPQLNTKVASLTEVLVEVDPENEEGEFLHVNVSATATLRKRVVRRLEAKCEISVNWHTPWLPPGTRFEYRYKKESLGKKGWQSDRTRGTRHTMRELPTYTDYTFQVRAQNDVGWGPWSPEATITTPHHPQPEKAVEGQL